MEARRLLRLGAVICVLAGLLLGGCALFGESRPSEQAGSAPSREALDRRDRAANRARILAERAKVRKITPVKGKVITGVFDKTIVDGRTGFERAVGRKTAVRAMYQAWGDDGSFPRGRATGVLKQKQVPMITWEPWKFSKTDLDQPQYRLSEIAAGKHDTYIRAWLLEARDLRGPIMVRFAHEMNGEWYPWGRHVNTPADYVAAWRHIVDLSRRSGVNNISWVWSPNEVREEDNLDDYYPGTDYVDWIGISGFNWGGLEKWQKWRSFNEIFGPTLSRVKKYDKPIVIAETGSIESPRPGGQSRAAWITETFAQVKVSDPPIAMLIWFNAPFTANKKTYDWQINASPTSVKAMRDGLADSVFLEQIF